MPINVHFRSSGVAIAGHVYVPEDYSPGQTRPAVVISPPGSGIKEQTAGRYAQELSARGFVTLAFDPRTFGESEGYPRCDEDPWVKVEDLKAALGYLGGRPEVDRNRIGALGICGGAGVVPLVAATDRRIKSVAAISGVFDQGGATRASFPNDAALIAALEGAAQARQAYEDGGEPTYHPLLPTPGSAEADNFPALMREAPAYYFDAARGGHPRWRNQSLAWSMAKMLTFSSLTLIDLIAPTPLLLVAGGNAASRPDNEEAFSRAQEPKELMLVEGASHIDLYDVDEYVDIVVDQLVEHFALV